MKILILGATGNTGSLVVEKLKKENANIAIMVRNREEAQELGLRPEQIREGDFESLDSLTGAMTEVDKVYLVMPMHKDCVSWVKNVLAAAKKAGVKHIVKQSGLDASSSANSQLIRDHYETDFLISKSGLEYTLIQPNSFFQNFYGNLPTINALGQFFSPLGNSRQSMVDINDVAEVISCVLTQDGHNNKIYRLTGPEALTSAEQAQILSEKSHKAISFVNVSSQDFEGALKSAGMGDWVSKNLAEMIEWFSVGEQYGDISNDIEKLLGRPPRKFADFAEELSHSIEA